MKPSLPQHSHEVTVSQMLPADLSGVVTTHLESFSGFFLSSLGHRFLFLYYSGLLASPDQIACVARDREQRVVGFVAGSANPRGFYRRLLRRDGFRFLRASVAPVLRTPSIVPRIARALLHPSSQPPGEHVAGLFSLGVLPQQQGRGIGRKLVASFLKEARNRGCTQVVLTTDKEGNDPVNAFYVASGFVLQQQYVTPEGRGMNEYCTTI